MSPDAIMMCDRRYGSEGLRTMAHQSVACATPPRISNPAGVCSHELSTTIQNADSLVPPATSTVASMCRWLPTRLWP